MTLYPSSVLIVEDQPEICDLIELSLLDKVNHIRKAYSCAQALEFFKHNPSFNLAIIDTCLPDGDPYNLIEHLLPRGCKILLMSGNFELNKRLACLPFPKLTKPFRIHTLVQSIEQAFLSKSY
ncbi:hypothetical protein COMNV_00293 [Commensalibacter sp. Nvir]|uniref:response regulator n=1 Tax=Commensalibacter sp. Nvir TaxID=3069817 RepID=UPI002D535029|nr:hypothetical protein COMNV_00293 [Commensalibacter sp. Nvir]